ncbi:MAG: xylulokinase [Acidimicrobiales bacterium]
MAGNKVALGIDIGTGSTKAGLVDADGHLVVVGRCSHPITEPQPGWSESDPRAWLLSARSAIAEVLAARPDDEVVAVGFSGQMHGVVLCDDSMQPVRPAVLWSDRRSQPHLDELRGKFSADDLARLANPVVAGMAGPNLAALARHEPSAVERTATIMQAKDWVRAQLTGEVATDPSDASATLLWDVMDDRWSAAAGEVFGVRSTMLPSVIDSFDVAGAVTETGGALFGLPAGIPVACGGADTACALLGAGVRAGEYQVSTGTGGQIAHPVIDPAAANPAAGTHCFRTVERRSDQTATAAPWYTMAATQNAGVAIDWALATLGLTLDEATRLVVETPIGSNGVTFLPYLTGERTPHLDVGLSGAWSGLRPATTRADLMRSVFEGVAFALRDGLDAMLRSSKPGSTPISAPEQALLAGGGSVAAWWRQMLADVLNLALVPHNAADASVRGAALLAWGSIDHPIDPGTAVTRLAMIEPDPRSATAYEGALNRFRAAGSAQR